MPGELPKVVRFLTEDLKFRLLQWDKDLGYEFYLVDLGDWKLRLSDRTPFIRIEPRHLEAVPLPDLLAGLRTLIRRHHFERRVPMMLVEGSASTLAEVLHSNFPYSVVIDQAQADRIAAPSNSDRPFLSLVCEQLPLASLAPYETSSPVTGSRFFGREYEIRTILNHPDTDYVILGVRRIGKSSLLLELKRRMAEMGDDDVYFFDCSDFYSTDDYIRAVTTAVDIRQRRRMTFAKFPNFLRVKSYQGKRPLTFLLDEVDHLIEFDRQQNWSLLNTLRSSANQGFCRYILTGYREAVRESVNDRAPLYNFVTSLRLGNLSRQETHDLVTVPLKNLGVSFQRHGELIGQIFQQTAGHPNFVQFYCYSLVQLMDREVRRQVGPGDLARVHGNPDFERYVFRTFTANTTDLEKAVVYSLVLEGNKSFTPRDVDVALKKRKVFARADKIDDACDNLRMAGILDKQGQRFSLAIPILNRLLRDHYDVEHLFAKAKEDGRLGYDRP